MAKLGVNIDHVATVRQARGTREPDPVDAAVLAQLGGADGITVHLREDRRHIQDRDVEVLRRSVHVPLNLEMGLAPDIIEIALRVKPAKACIVPEKRRELTTEGGLNIEQSRAKLAETLPKLLDCGVEVSLFIDPVEDAVRAAREIGARAVELHTGAYAEAGGAERERALDALAGSAKLAREIGLVVNMGHGIDYRNIALLRGRFDPVEYNIGHAIIARAVLVGLERAVREMKDLVA